MLFAGWPLPIWIRDSTDNIQYSNHTIMPKSTRSLCNQASTLPGAVRYLENTMQCKMFPHYKKPCAPSLVRLGLHRSLVGGMSSRPSLPSADRAIHLISQYSVLPDQNYPLNVRLPVPLPTDLPVPELDLPTSLSFQARQNLYQRSRSSFA